MTQKLIKTSIEYYSKHNGAEVFRDYLDNLTPVCKFSTLIPIHFLRY